MSGAGGGGGEPGLWVAAVHRRKVPRGPDWVPPAGDGVGAQIELINRVKSKSIVVLSAFLLEVRSGFQFCLVPNWEACVTC